MQAFGRVNELFRRMVDSKQYEDMEDVCINAILEGVRKSSGFGHFPQSQWRDFIALRRSLTHAHTEVLIMCQFNSVSGRIKLKSSNFKEVSKLDKSCPWIKVGLMLYGYQISLGTKTRVNLLKSFPRLTRALWTSPPAQRGTPKACQAMLSGNCKAR